MDNGGIPILNYLENNGGIFTQELLRQLIEKLEGLDKLDIIHNDGNPLNILVSSSGKLKMIDYGFSKKFPKDRKYWSNLLMLGNIFFSSSQGLINLHESSIKNSDNLRMAIEDILEDVNQKVKFETYTKHAAIVLL